MRASDIVVQLREFLIPLTNQFTEELPVSTLTFSGGTVTGTTVVPHGFAPGEEVNIIGALTPFSITSLTHLDGVATAVTSTDHGLTFGFPTDPRNVEITGADQPEYNGFHKLLSVPNRTTFTYEIVGTPITPATGTIFLLENNPRGYNGRHIVAVPTVTTFTYPSLDTLLSPAQGAPIVRSGSRITRALDLSRATQSYTRQDTNKLWMYVVLDSTVASKDRRVDTDATAWTTGSSQFSMTLLKTFTLYVYVPLEQTGESIAGGKERDDMEDLEVLLYKSLANASIPSGFFQPVTYTVVPLANAGEIFEIPALYVHGFTFEVSTLITNCDVFEPDESVPFRDIHIDFKESVPSSNPDLIRQMTDIKLDSEPE